MLHLQVKYNNIRQMRLTMTTTGFVLIFFALAAYLNVLEDSDWLDLAGETQAICHKMVRWQFVT